MRTTPRSLLGLLPIVGTLLLTACQQMVTNPMGAPGSPLSANKEEKTVSEKFSDSDEAIAPPLAAAPIPPPPTGGGDDPAATTPPPMEPAFRRIEGGSTGDETTVATNDRGLISAPSSTEMIERAAYSVRALYWPIGVRRSWSTPEQFRDKLLLGEIPLATIQAAQVKYYFLEPTLALREIAPGSFMGGLEVTDERVREEIINNLSEPGYYLVYKMNGELFDMEPRSLATIEEAKAFVNDDKQLYVGERFVPSFLIRVITPELFLPLPLPSARELPPVDLAPILR